VATKWFNDDRQNAEEWLQSEIHLVIPVKYKLFIKLFLHHERQPQYLVEINGTEPRSIFDKKPARMKNAAEPEIYRVANMTLNKSAQLPVPLLDAETDANPWVMCDMTLLVNLQEGDIHPVTSNMQMQFKLAFYMDLIEFAAWWPTISFSHIKKTIEQCITHFGYPNMHLVSSLSVSIGEMCSRDNFTTDNSELLHISNVKEACLSSNKVKFIRQRLKINDW